MTAPVAPFGRDVIMELIPHRPPFLLVDEIVELDPGKRVVEPGDVLTLECEFVRVRGPIAKGEGRATVDGELAVEALLTVFVGE